MDLFIVTSMNSISFSMMRKSPYLLISLKWYPHLIQMLNGEFIIKAVKSIHSKFGAILLFHQKNTTVRNSHLKNSFCKKKILSQGINLYQNYNNWLYKKKNQFSLKYINFYKKKKDPMKKNTWIDPCLFSPVYTSIKFFPPAFV